MPNNQILRYARGRQREEEPVTAIVRDADSTAVKVVWEYWRAGYERSFHGEPAVVELGEIQ
jgi:hypothetical protein